MLHALCVVGYVIGGVLVIHMRLERLGGFCSRSILPLRCGDGVSWWGLVVWEAKGTRIMSEMDDRVGLIDMHVTFRFFLFYVVLDFFLSFQKCQRWFLFIDHILR